VGCALPRRCALGERRVRPRGVKTAAARSRVGLQALEPRARLRDFVYLLTSSKVSKRWNFDSHFYLFSTPYF
jgi:hypothetical protein